MKWKTLSSTGRGLGIKQLKQLLPSVATLGFEGWMTKAKLGS
jgi:hypothetical protein